MLIGITGMMLKNRKSLAMIFAGTLSSSVLFFVITNFGVWFSGTMYTKTFEGLATCYVAAIPFFRNTLAGDVFYVAVLFGVYELALRFVLERKTVHV